MKEKKNQIIVLSVVFLFIIILTALSIKNKREENKIEESGNQTQIVTTLFPLYDMAKKIGGEKVEVSLLLPPGVEAHSYEPKPSDILKINNSDVFIYTGEFMEPWVHDMLQSLNGKVKVLDASTGVRFIKGNDDEHEDEHGLDGVDPHIWLDFDNAKIMSQNIKNALSVVDPDNSLFYEKNLDFYKKELSQIDNSYKTDLSVCDTKTVIYGGHYAFGYLARRYGLKYEAAQGLAPDSEPSASDLVKLVNQIKKENIKTVFYEELESPKVAETLSKETGARMIKLNSAHNPSKEQFDSGISFFDILEANLFGLKDGLGCKK